MTICLDNFVFLGRRGGQTPLNLFLSSHGFRLQLNRFFFRRFGMTCNVIFLNFSPHSDCQEQSGRLSHLAFSYRNLKASC